MSVEQGGAERDGLTCVLSNSVLTELATRTSAVTSFMPTHKQMLSYDITCTVVSWLVLTGKSTSVSEGTDL